MKGNDISHSGHAPRELSQRRFTSRLSTGSSQLDRRGGVLARGAAVGAGSPVWPGSGVDYYPSHFLEKFGSIIGLSHTLELWMVCMPCFLAHTAQVVQSGSSVRV